MALTVASRHYVPKAPVRLHKPLPVKPSSGGDLPVDVASAPKGWMMVPLYEKKTKQRPPPLSLNSISRKTIISNAAKEKQENSHATQFSILPFTIRPVRIRFPSLAVFRRRN